MIVHIVMFKFNEQDKSKNLVLVKDRLEGLVSKIPTLKSMEVGIDFNQSERAFDLSLYSTFDNKDDLKSYALHPEHLSVVELVKRATTQSRVVDYTV
ncbi:MAG: Dabb family protein [Sulfurimonas sp.]|nr:Dabb family protein [Sulfurimonas sp.]